MKTHVHCPHCQGHRIKTISKTTQIIIGLAIAVVGIGFFVPALFTAVGYYLFALPLFTVGAIRAYKSYSDPMGRAYCHDCHQEFEYYRAE